MSVKKIEGRPEEWKPIKPYRREEVEDLLFMIADGDPGWRDPKTITLTVGRIELERLFVTALESFEKGFHLKRKAT